MTELRLVRFSPHIRGQHYGTQSPREAIKLGAAEDSNGFFYTAGCESVI